MLDMIHARTGIWREHISESLAKGEETEVVYPMIHFSLHVYFMQVQPRHKKKG